MVPGERVRVAVQTVLVVAANPFELKFVPQTGKRVRFAFACGGEGPRLVQRAMDSVKGPFDAIVSTGMCGALDPALQVGDVFVAESVNGGLPCRLPATSLEYRQGRLLSVDRIVGTVAERQALYASGYAAVEMEAAAVEARARESGTRFYCIRAVSDAASEEFVVDLNAARDGEGKIRVGRILWQAAFRPVAAFPQLLQLKRNSDVAARTLGAFLATCDF